MGYLRLQDYLLHIQEPTLQQIISNNSSVLMQAEELAQAEIVSHLTQRYDTDSEFQDTIIYNPTLIYNAQALVQLDGELFVSGTYAANAIVLFSGSVYQKNSNTSGYTNQPPTDVLYWILLGKQYQLFNTVLPYPTWSYKIEYSTGDKVFWQNKVYTANSATLGIMPTNKANGEYYWGNGVPYSVPALTLLSDTTKWAMGDNRSPQCFNYMIDIVIYHILSRITPKNIPQIRIDRYQQALDWMTSISTSESTSDLPEYPPYKGRRIRFSSNLKNINSY